MQAERRSRHYFLVEQDFRVHPLRLHFEKRFEDGDFSYEARDCLERLSSLRESTRRECNRRGSTVAYERGIHSPREFLDGGPVGQSDLAHVGQILHVLV